MCIIVAKRKGYSLPGKERLKRCWDKNPQGAGIAYYSDNHVKIEKGFMKWENLWSRLKELNKEINLRDSSMIVHFRISTSGKVDQGNCHPFPVTSDKSVIREIHTKCDIAVAHNGIIHDFNNVSEVYNDTQLFIMKVLMPLYNLNERHDFYKEEKIRYLIRNSIDESRLVFIDSNNELITIGNWYEDRGILYSNKGYRKQNYTYFTKKGLLDEDMYYIDGQLHSREFYELFLCELEPLTEDVYSVDGFDTWSVEDGLNYLINPLNYTIYLEEDGLGFHDLYCLGEYTQ